jgi:hypothetical protein
MPLEESQGTFEIPNLSGGQHPTRHAWQATGDSVLLMANGEHHHGKTPATCQAKHRHLNQLQMSIGPIAPHFNPFGRASAFVVDKILHGPTTNEATMEPPLYHQLRETGMEKLRISQKPARAPGSGKLGRRP